MITKAEINKVQSEAKTIKAVVVGDTMLDKYIYGSVDRISPEAPVPVLTHHKTELKAGGAANVALNMAAWGCETTLIGLSGNDGNQQLLRSILDSHSIKHHLLASDDRPTTVKTRVVASSHHLLRIDEESSVYLDGEAEQRVIEFLETKLENESVDLIIIQDYNKGFLTASFIDHVINIGRKKKAFIAVDPKEKHFFNYRNADLFKPNLREAGLAANRTLHHQDVSSVASDWRKQMNVGTIAITLGSQGVYLQNQADDVFVKPEKAIDVVDVCGAGDAVICSLALALMTGLDLQKSGSLANLTGAFVCSHSGVVATDPTEIMLWI